MSVHGVNARVSASAFHDAVRDILRADGVFRLASYEDPTLVWEWDGERWARTYLEGNRSRRT